MAITIELSENGYIHIDMPSKDAEAIGCPMWSPSADSVATELAKAVTTDGREPVLFTRVSPKRGLRNAGWTATFRDMAKYGRFLASR